MADNIIAAYLMLANGSLMAVSETQQHNLFWAVRSAGHNFGTVTSIEYRIFEVLPEKRQLVCDKLFYAL